MEECTFKVIAGFILPIEGGPSSQPHEQPFRRSCRNPWVVPREGERNDEDTAGFQNRMRLPQETNPTPPRKDIAIGDICQEQIVKGFLRVGEVMHQVGHCKPNGQIRLLSSTPPLSYHPRA